MSMRSLHLRGALGAVRTETWDGREHLVVPVVALQEAVIHAVNAKTAEYVRRDALAASVGKWNGHPLVVGHPVKDGKQISAHSPEVLAAHGFGFIRSSTMNGARLGMEAMVDVARLEALNQKKLLADLRAGKGIEVSVGAFVNTNDKKAEFGGKAYDGEWTEITPDHLAFLPGGIGACSMAMGCGAHRAAMLVTAEGFEALSNPEGINQYSHGGGKSTDEHLREESKWEGHNGSTTPQAGDVVNVHLKGHEGKQGTVTQSHGSFHSIKTSKGSHETFHSSDLRVVRSHDGRSRQRVKGLSMNLKSLRAKMLALFDTPEQAASEEAAELIAYQSMRDLFDSAGDQWDAASSLIDDLIADEEENPTVTRQQEDAEEEVEDARLDAIRMHCYAMISVLQSVCNACSEQQMPEPMATSDPRYMEAFKAAGERMRAAIGKEISAKNLKTIQSAHDASHDMHTHTVALGAECSGMKTLAQKDCTACDGEGTIDGKDCTACEGTGQMKTAEGHGNSAEEGSMTPEQKALALKALATCGCEEAKIKALTTDEQITAALLEQSEKQAATIKAAADKQVEADAKLKEADAKLKAAEAAQIPAEELTELRTLATERKAKDAAEKLDLVTKITAASKAYTKEQLEAKDLPDLRALASLAKVQAVDFSIKGIPVQRSAQGAEDYSAPDSYGLKALQGGDAKTKETVN